MLDNENRILFNQWFDRGIERSVEWRDGDAFSEFYRAFNVVMATLSGKKMDRQMLEWVKTQESMLKDAFEKRLEYEPFIVQLNLLKKMCPIHDGRDGGNPLEINDIRNMGQVLEVIYRIRCNFFHGNKPVDIDRNQRFFDVGAHILKYWLEVIRADSQ